MKTLRRCLLAVVTMTLAGGGMAHANSGNTAPLGVAGVAYASSTNMFLTLSDTNSYMAVATYSPCGGVPAPSLDTVKIWISLGQAALLSGKQVIVGWNDCGTSQRFITAVTLNQ